jgi:4-amino-4-deoxy-L-arabinose transferase-like glycosyltransferase
VARRDGLWLCAIVVVALAMRLAFIAATPSYDPILHDDGGYNQLACAVSQQGSYPRYPDPAHHATAYRPPVYPYFLASIYTATGCNPQATPTTRTAWPRIVGALLGVISVIFVAWLATRWWARGAGIAAGLLAALFGPAIIVDSQLLSESLFTALVLAAVVAVVLLRDDPRRLRLAIIAGVAAGLATLTRTNGALLVPALAAGAWVLRPRWSRRGLMAPLVILVSAALVVLPWTLRNARDVHGLVVVSDEVGGTLAGTYNDVARTDPFGPGAWTIPESVPRYQPLFVTARRLDLPETTVARRLLQSALGYATAHPGYIAEVAGYNTLRLAGIGGQQDFLTSGRALRLSQWTTSLALVTSQFIALFALVGALSGAARGSPRFVWIAVLLLFVTTVLVNADALRFQVPFGPFEALLAGAAITALIRSARRGRPDLVQGAGVAMSFNRVPD